MFKSPTAMREAFGKAMVDLGKQNDRVVALTADLTDAIKTDGFQECLSEPFFPDGY